MAAAQRAAATNGLDPDPGPDPGTGAGFCQSAVSILDNHVLDYHVWRSLKESGKSGKYMEQSGNTVIV